MGKALKLVAAAGLAALVLLGSSSCGKKTEKKVISPPPQGPGATKSSVPVKAEEQTVVPDDYQVPGSRETSKSIKKPSPPPEASPADTDDKGKTPNRKEPPAD